MDVYPKDIFAEAEREWRNGPWYARLAYWLLKRGRFFFIPGRKSDDVYLARFHILKLKMKRKTPTGVRKPQTVFGIYLHRFYRGDDDPALHDHPWPFGGIVLSGGYIEQKEFYQRWRRPGSLMFVGIRSFHRVRLDRNRSKGKPVWTLVIVGPKLKRWGFIPHGLRKWMAWCRYLGVPQNELPEDEVC